MKRIIFILLLTLLFSPALAQVSKAAGTGIKLATQSDIALKVGQLTAQQTARQTAFLPPVIARIENWGGKPSIRVLQQQAGKITVPSAVEPLTARILNWETAAQYILPAGWDAHVAYIPASWNTPNLPFWYRDLKIPHLRDLKNLLEKGLELGKVSPRYPGNFSTSYLDTALKYGIPRGAVGPVLPVVVKMRDDPELAKTKQPGRVDFMPVFRADIKPEYIEDVMVFLEINGYPGWYKVVLQEGEVVFIPVLGSVITW